MKFDDYATGYRSIKMRREDGILELTFHTNDGPLEWGTSTERTPSLQVRSRTSPATLTTAS